MSNDFRDRMLAATKVLRGRELELKKQIGAIYASCARDMEKEILKYGADSLAGRRAVTLQKSMRGYVKRLWREVHATAERAARDGAEIGIGIQTSLLDDALHGFGISTRASFAGAFGHTQDEAVTAVLNGSVYKGKRAALSRRIWNNEALQGGQIERLIAEATAQGRSAVELAKDLTAYINPDARMPDHWNEIYPMPFVYKTDYNAKRLAVTTLNHGYYQGMIMAARENPFAEYLHWELSSFHTIYDVCDLYMEHDEGLGLGNFALDSPDLPLPHPFCRCNYYIDSDKSLKEIGQEIGGWMNGEENLRLERAFGEWKLANLGKVDIIQLSDMKIFRSMGAKHITDQSIRVPGDFENEARFVQGKYIQNRQVFAGYGTRTPLHEGVVEWLVETYGGVPELWQHAKGIAYIDYLGEERFAEIHWFQQPGIIEHYVLKKWLD